MGKKQNLNCSHSCWKPSHADGELYQCFAHTGSVVTDLRDLTSQLEAGVRSLNTPAPDCKLKEKIDLNLFKCQVRRLGDLPSAFIHKHIHLSISLLPMLPTQA